MRRREFIAVLGDASSSGGARAGRDNLRVVAAQHRFSATVNRVAAGEARIVAVHEAGHAVGRILTARRLGWREDEAVARIEVRATPTTIGKLQAATYGPLLSRPMDEYCAANHAGRIVGAPLFADLRTAGFDLITWFNTRCTFILFGPMAESKFTGRLFDEVLGSKAAEDDLRDIMLGGTWCGLSKREISDAIQNNTAIVEECIAEPDVWRAILTLADKLKPGTMIGSRAALIILEALAKE
jgi:antitoxin (DNA-binding transcriptional repressor) of toxin-antitoxin stability system